MKIADHQKLMKYDRNCGEYFWGSREHATELLDRTGELDASEFQWTF